MQVTWSIGAEQQATILARHFHLTREQLNRMREIAEEKATASRLFGMGIVRENATLLTLTDAELRRMDNTPPQVLPADVRDGYYAIGG